MELEALQLPEADLQVLSLEPPVSPPDQVVSIQWRGLTSASREKGRACWVGGLRFAGQCSHGCWLLGCCFSEAL